MCLMTFGCWASIKQFIVMPGRENLCFLNECMCVCAYVRVILCVKIELYMLDQTDRWTDGWIAKWMRGWTLIPTYMGTYQSSKAGM